LWKQITEVAKDIMTASIKVVSKGPADILGHLRENLDKGEGQKCQSHISHMAEVPQLKMLLGSDVSAPDSKLDEILEVFTKVCSLESEIVQNQLRKYKVDDSKEDAEKVEKMTPDELKLIGACEEFIINVAEELNSRYSSKSEEYSRRLKDLKKKASILKPDAEQSKLAQSISLASEVIFKQLSAWYSIIFGQLEESFKNKTEDEHWEGVEEKFKAYQETVCGILRSQ
jgi:vacuolar-type H+-ATPase subunit I/STV1